MKREERDRQTYAIIGAAMEVHNLLGPGFLESVYHEALCRELTRAEVPHRSEVPLTIKYRGLPLASTYRADLVCFGEVIVELKALGSIGANEKCQMLNYLRASGCTRGLLLNFGTRSLQYIRFIQTPRPVGAE